MAISLILVVSLAVPAMADSYTIDDVKAMIELLPNFPEVTEADRGAIEAAQSAYYSLSAEDRGALDSAVGSYTYNTQQPYGRVLEIAEWGLYSLDGVDDSTTLPDGTYSSDTTPALSSGYSKGMSTSVRQKPWSVKDVTVENGKAVATLTVESETYSGIFTGGAYYPRTNSSGYCEFAGVPIDLNGILYFAGDSDTMPVPIAFYVYTSIDETYVPDTPPVDPGIVDDPEPIVVTEPPAPLKDGAIELSITNTTGMFKAVSSSIETKDGASELVFALSGTSYQYLFKGTYEQAVANGDNRESWIEGKENADGKLEYRIPVAQGETVIPVVSISNSYLAKFESGETSLARAFYPRQFVLDVEAKTLVVGDYEGSKDLSVTNNVEVFKVSKTKFVTVGGPNSNNYKANLTLVMGSEDFNAAYVGRASAIRDDATVIGLAEGNVFELPVKWVAEFGKPETLVDLLEKPFVVSFRSAKDGSWSECQFTVSESAGTLVIDEAPAAPAFADVPETAYCFEAVNWAVEKKITDGMTDTEFKPDLSCKRGQIVTFLWRAAGCPAVSGSNPFTDVKESDYFYEAVLWAVANGITDGMTATEFKPDLDCTRLQAVTFMWRAASKPASQAASAFTDVTSGADAVNWAVEKAITDGTTDTTFSPTNTCTRGQIVTFLYRADKA